MVTKLVEGLKTKTTRDFNAGMDIGRFYQAVNRLADTGEYSWVDKAKEVAIAAGHAGMLTHLEEAIGYTFTDDERFEALRNSVTAYEKAIRPHETAITEVLEKVDEKDTERRSGLERMLPKRAEYTDRNASIGALYRQLFRGKEDDVLEKYVEKLVLSRIVASQIIGSVDLQEADRNLDRAKDGILAKIEELNEQNKRPLDAELEKVIVGRASEVISDLDENVSRIRANAETGIYNLRDVADLDFLIDSCDLLEGDRRLGRQQSKSRACSVVLNTSMSMIDLHPTLSKDTLRNEEGVSTWKFLVATVGKYLRKLGDRETVEKYLPRMEARAEAIENRLADNNDG